MIINDSITGLFIYSSMLFLTVLKYTPFAYIKVYRKAVCCVMVAAGHIFVGRNPCKIRKVPLCREACQTKHFLV